MNRKQLEKFGKSGRTRLQAFKQEAHGSTENIWDDFTTKLLAATQGCRPSMHEPDEQGIEAHLIVGPFDNAGGAEMALAIERYVGDGSQRKSVERFNMADLVALARLGAALWIDSRIDDLDKERILRERTK